MIAKTAEGLLGANNAMNVIRTPMKVFKEARARGDKETMDRAMGYVEKAHDEAWEKKYSADEGLKQEAEENKLKAEQQREELAQRIRENRNELESRIEESSGENAAVPTISQGSEGDTAADNISKIVTEAASIETTVSASSVPVTYTRSGEIKTAETGTEFSITV